MKKVLKGKKEIVAHKLSANISPSKIGTSSNKVLTSASYIANEFNHYFSNFGKTLSQAIPLVDINFSTFLSQLSSYSFFLMLHLFRKYKTLFLV